MKRKSIPTAVILAALIGPFGLFYVSAWQAILAVVAWLLVVPSTLLADPTTGAVIFWAFWALCIWAAWLIARERNRDADQIEAERKREAVRAKAEERLRHAEILAAIDRAGRPVS